MLFTLSFFPQGKPGPQLFVKIQVHFQGCRNPPFAEAPLMCKHGRGVPRVVTCHILPIFSSFFQVAQAPRGCLGLSHVRKGGRWGVHCFSEFVLHMSWPLFLQPPLHFMFCPQLADPIPQNPAKCGSLSAPVVWRTGRTRADTTSRVQAAVTGVLARYLAFAISLFIPLSPSPAQVPPTRKHRGGCLGLSHVLTQGRGR